MQLDFTLNINNDTWYPTADISGFKSKTGGRIDIKEKLILTFSAPGKITEGDITVSSNPWIYFKTQIESTEVGKGVFDIIVTISAKDGQAIGNAITNIHMGVNASSDTAPKWASMSDSFTAAADGVPDVDGELVIDCAALPAGLESRDLQLELVRGEKKELLTIKAGTSALKVAAGTYRVQANDLCTLDGTLRAAVKLSAAEVVINKGQRSHLQVSFARTVRSTTIDIAVDLPNVPALIEEDLDVVCLENGVVKHRYTLRHGQKQRLENLPVSGKFVVRINDLKLNNVHYVFSDITGNLNGQFHDVAFTGAKLQQRDDTQSGSAKLVINIKAEKAVPTTFDLRLTDGKDTARQYRFASLPVRSGNREQSVLVARGSYQVESCSFIYNGVVHYVDAAPCPLTVDSSKPLQLDVTITEGANLHVKGFPEFLSFGGCADMSPSNVDDLAEARVSSLFKYSGDDGMGDASDYLDPAKEPTSKIIQMARDVSAKTSEPVLPVMVSYTCNLSLGDVERIIKDPVRHHYSFANFIQSLKMAQAMRDDAHPVPAGYIVNPDYLGECQKYGFAPEHAIPVRQPLSEALAHHGVNVTIPAAITDTLKGYIRAVNWLVRVVAPDVVLGWQVNLWGVGGSQWIYSDFTYDDVFDPADGKHKKMTLDPKLAGKLTAEYALLVGVFDEIPYTRTDGSSAVAKGADFMAADRYEADDFTARAYKNGYCYTPYEWDRTFDFCTALSRYLRQPVLPWQVPASRLATKDEQVGELEEQFWGTGGSYLMGHPEIGHSVEAINDRLLNIEFLDVHAKMMGHTPRELFNRHAWDMSEPKYRDFPLRGIFHVQVGGGATTGVVSAVNRNSSSWMRSRLKAYRDNPVKFKG
ncbi:hypothetical protein [Enterobacter sp.]|uniref:hypothetical protein n=1 Tax=Enterobacter sp. TaxID=42895 RepID=UPI00296FA2D0|nr:hypothetical protein [Enterobacter sp.]